MLKIVMIFFQTHRRSAQLDNEHKFQFLEQSVPATAVDKKLFSER